MNQILPVMLLKGLVLLPNQEVRLELNNELSAKVVKLATKYHQGRLLVVCPRDQFEEAPEVSDLPLVSVIGKIKSKIELPNGNIRVTITGLKRVKILAYSNHQDDSELLEAQYNELILPKFEPIEESALKRKLLEVLADYIKAVPYISNSIFTIINGVEDVNKLTDIIASFVPFSVAKKIAYMEEINALYRAKNLIQDLNIELQIAELDKKIDESLKAEFETNQKEFILREKINQIRKELGEESAKDELIYSYLDKLNTLKLNEKTHKKILTEIKKFEYTNESSPELSILRNYLDLILNLPWHKYTTDESDLVKIKAHLDATHYGLEKIKDRIIEYIAVKLRNPNINSPILCFVGPPGVGKTSLGVGIAQSLQKEFYKISVGGLNDSAELNGHRRTYIGASCGKIIQAISKCESSNPLILIDEVDKMVKDYKGDPASVLLDILDYEQNKIFTDNYLEEPFDLSKVLFILTANDLNAIPEVLKDRLEIIELTSYTDYEKVDIAQQHLLPKIFSEHLITKTNIKFSEPILLTIIRHYTQEAGVRDLERKLSMIVRKIITASMIANKTKITKTITSNDLNLYLGKEQYHEEIKITNYLPGLVNGLAYTPLGGLVMPIEACLYNGKGEVEVTGMLGQVMNESIKVAISYLKAFKDNYQINDYYFDQKNLHLHFLEAAVAKDGPSAGVAIVTSLLSLLLNKTVPQDIAMTGEISLRGDVLPVGGLKEKIIGGYNNRIKTFIIPWENEKDLVDIPQNILPEIKIMPIKNYQELYDYLFKQ
ncbi:MAG TPA: endopeptidase La [Bacilli bacterium]|nr:endopeptidase La [Bacilli bacterium]